MGAMAEISREVSRAWSGNHRSGKVVVLITFEFKNDFNTVRWTDLFDALQKKFKVPSNLLRVISDYLSNRHLLYETTEGIKQKKVSAGVAQGAVLGTDLWNVVYDDVLRLNLLVDCKLIFFADDLVATILARNKKEARIKATIVSVNVENWLSDHGLK
ncbi:uncharacterized protein LOC117176613 [Belonocnema kinseyi]|uniref:uncharacterized protein LOC117176613 n=1 Tax=Belonocnema kinseyi TaxID=2817044 RepID=UPI00143D1EE6|nr:uncharacterized protein LOC117176613 [Belonocnema kinseyi]